MSREEPGLVERILDLPADEDGQRAATFARGLVLGALVGAAIAGSTIWQRRHPRPKARFGPVVGGSDDADTRIGHQPD